MKTPFFFRSKDERPDSDSFQDCLDALRYDDPTVRKNALKNILDNYIEHITNIEPFGIIMRNDDNLDAQELAMQILGKVGSQECIDELAYMVSNPDQWVRAKAISVLAKMNSVRAYYALKETCKTIRPEFQQSVKRSLEQMRKELKIDDDLDIATGSLKKPTDNFNSKNNIIAYDGSDTQTKLSYEILDDEDDIQSLPFNYIFHDDAKRKNTTLKEEEINSPYLTAENQEISAENSLKAKQIDSGLKEMLAHHLKTASNSEPDQEILENCINAYLSHDDDAERNLCFKADHGDYAVSLQALHALAILNSPTKFLPVFLRKLTSDDPRAALQGLIPLLNTYDLNVAKAVFPLLDSDDEQLKKFAVSYFTNNTGTEITDYIYSKITNGSKQEKVLALSLLTRLDISETKKYLNKILQNPESSDESIISIFDRLPSKYSDLVVLALPALIMRNNEYIYAEIGRFLKNCSSIIAEEYLIQNLQTKNTILRGKSIFLLAKMKSKQGEAYLSSMITDLSDYTRLQTAKAIYEYNNKDYYELIVLALQSDKHIGNRIEYIKLAAQIYGKHITTKLISMLPEAEPEIIFAILETIGKINQEEYLGKTLAALKQYMQHSDMRIVYYALVAQVRLGIFDFGQYQQKMLRMLWSIITNKANSSKIRKESLECLCKLAKEESYNVLIDIITTDKDEALIIAAMRYLASYKTEKTKETLSIMIKHPNKNIAETASKLICSI